MQVGRGRTLLVDSQSCEDVQDLGVDVLPTVGNDTDNDLRRRSEAVRMRTTLLNAERGDTAPSSNRPCPSSSSAGHRDD